MTKVTGKKSSWILIYQNKYTSFYTQKDSVIKIKWNYGAWLKEGEFNWGMFQFTNGYVLIYKWLEEKPELRIIRSFTKTVLSHQSTNIIPANRHK